MYKRLLLRINYGAFNMNCTVVRTKGETQKYKNLVGNKCEWNSKIRQNKESS